MWIFKRCSFSDTIPLVIRKCPFTEYLFVFSYVSFVGLKASLQATQLTPIISNAVVFHGSLASSTFLPQLTTFGFSFFLFCFVFQKDPVNSLENLEEKKFAGETSIPSPKPKLHSRDLKKELITWVGLGYLQEKIWQLGETHLQLGAITLRFLQWKF